MTMGIGKTATVNPEDFKGLPKETCTWLVEYTDTFGGEPNYCWVKRETIEIPIGLNNGQVMRRCKAAMGIAGKRGRGMFHGDSLEFKPYGHLTIMMARVEY